jgi:iron(III) transport system permease protein
VVAIGRRLAVVGLPALGWRHGLGLALILVVGTITVLPLAFVVVNSFNVAEPGRMWTFGFQGWSDALFGSARTQSALGYSLLLSSRAPLSVAVAFLIAWLLIRVQIPGRNVIEVLLWGAFFLPALPVTLGWLLLLDPNSGVVNVFLKSLGSDLGPIDVQSVPGIMWVHMSVATVPVMTMLLAPAFRMMDASLEEASRVCGSGNGRTLRRITLPLIFPACLTALLAGLIRSLEAFEVEQLLGPPSGIYVYATRIYDLINYEPPKFAQAMALSTFILCVLCLLALGYQRAIARRNFATVSGRGMSARPLAAGRWRYAASAVLGVYIFVGVVVPVAMLTLGSFMTLFGFFDIQTPFTTVHWRRVLGSQVFELALTNTLILSLGAAVIGVAFYSLVGYVLARSNLAGRRLIGLMTWLPWAVPGMLLSVGLLWLLLSSPVLGFLYGNLGALMLALIIKELPLGANLTNTAFLQISSELEQSSRTCGAGWFRTYRRIMLPLIAPTLVSIFVITLISALRDISTIVLLMTPSTRSLSLLMFEFATSGHRESATVLGLIVTMIALGVALVARRLGLSMGVAR